MSTVCLLAYTYTHTRTGQGRRSAHARARSLSLSLVPVAEDEVEHVVKECGQECPRLCGAARQLRNVELDDLHRLEHLRVKAHRLELLQDLCVLKQADRGGIQ